MMSLFHELYLSALLALLVGPVAGQLLDVDGPEEKEDTVAETLLSPVLKLNHMTFGGNVLQPPGGTEYVGQWIVSFCPSWWEPCQRIATPYAEMTSTWQAKLNTALLTREVRFATVDCAIDKVLCNEQNVESYPTVHRYKDGKRVASWSGGRKDDPDRLAKWLQRQLADASKPAPGADGGLSAKLSQNFWPGDRVLDLLLVLAVLALNFRAICSNPSLSQKQPSVATSRQSVRHAQPAQIQVPGTERFLPQTWAAGRPGLWL